VEFDAAGWDLDPINFELVYHLVSLAGCISAVVSITISSFFFAPSDGAVVARAVVFLAQSG